MRGALEWVGLVTRLPDPYIARQTWLDLVAFFKLKPIDSFTSVSPFTGGLVEHSRPTCEPAAYPGRGKRIGVVVWWPEGKGLELYGDPDEMARLGEKIAETVGGEYGPPGS